MSARYLIRLDDANHYMNDLKWLRMEQLLGELGIKPIVAVVPKNKDPELMGGSFNHDFWQIVRRWQDKGWSIALHGFEHKFHHVARSKTVIPLYDRSEFAGLDFSAQSAKIRKSVEIFKYNDVIPKIWVAPAHSFDWVTLDALKQETDIRLVSDGIALNPYRKNGFDFIPQQLWDVRQCHFGTWTICIHPETMDEMAFDELHKKLSHPAIIGNIIEVKDVPHSASDKKFTDKVYANAFWNMHKFKRQIKAKLPLRFNR